MKALSYIVASILMLIITIALSGTAYLYISGVFTATVQGIEVADAYCSLGEVTLSIRNIGSSSITKLDIEQTNPKDDFLTPSFQGTIEPGKTIQYKDTCEGEQSRKCMYRITPPAGKTITSDVTCTGKPESLVLSLHFDESSGIAMTDSSGNNNNGIFYGESFNDGELSPNYPTDAPQRVDGNFGKALEFDGNNDYVSVPDSTSLSPTQKITIVFWWKSKGYRTNDWHIAIDKWGGSNPEQSYLIGYETWSSPSLQFEIGDGTGNKYWASYSGSLSTDTWYYVAGTYDGTNIKLYLNGQPVGLDNQGTPISSIVDSSVPLEIGKQGGGNNFNGTIDEVRIYNRALTQSEIRAEMQSPIPIIRSVASYSFEETGQYVNDTHIWVKGKYGSALSFDGINDYVNVTYASSLDISNQITLMAQVKFSSCTNGRIMAKQYPVTEQYGLLTEPNCNYIQFAVANTTNDVNRVNSNPVSVGVWYHVTGVFDGNSLKIYINGILENTNNLPQTTSMPIGIGDLTIGTNPGRFRWFNGTIDEVRIYNKAII